MQLELKPHKLSLLCRPCLINPLVETEPPNLVGGMSVLSSRQKDELYVFAQRPFDSSLNDTVVIGTGHCSIT